MRDYLRTDGGQRRSDLDLLRVLGMSLVFLFHCLQPFNPEATWHILNGETSELAGLAISFLNIWFMPLFIFLAGASAYFSLQRRSNGEFLWERTKRILFPLIVGILLLIPPQIYCERLQRKQYSGSFWDFYPQFFHGVYPRGNFSYHHLWFLAYLFAYSVVGLGVFRFFQSERGNKFLALIVRGGRSEAGLFLFALPLAFFQIWLGRRYPQTNRLSRDWAWHSQLFLCFVFGYIFVSEHRFADSLVRARWKYFAAALLFTITIYTLRRWHPSVQSSYYYAGYALRAAAYRFATWSWILALSGLAAKFCDAAASSQQKSLQKMNEATLPLYILHQTIIVAVAYWVVQLSLIVALKFTLLFVFSAALTLLAYKSLRRWNVTRVLIGLPLVQRKKWREVFAS